MKKNDAFTAASLLALSALCIFPTNLYLPIMPHIQKHFGMMQHTIQLSITLYLAAEAISPLFIGSAMEKWGKRSVMIWLCLLFIIGSALCLKSHATWLFLTGRILQGVGISGLKIGKRALYRDNFSGHKLASLFAYTLPIVSLSLSISPIVGGYGQTYFGWQSFFYLSIAIYTVIFFFILMLIPNNQKQPKNPQKAHKIYWQLICNKSFLLWTTCSGLSLAFVMAYQTSSPLLYQNLLGLSAIRHGWISALIIIAMGTGSLVTHRHYKRIGGQKLSQGASCFLVAAGALACLCHVTGLFNPWCLILPYTLGMVGVTITFACAITEVMNPNGHISGYAAALYSGHKHVVAALASLALTLIPESSMLPLALIWLGIGLLQLTCLYHLAKAD